MSTPAKRRKQKPCYPPEVHLIPLQESTSENSKAKTLLGESVIRYDSTIHSAYRMSYGIRGWYKAYITSEDFENESDYFKEQSFETYQNLISMFSFMEPVIDQFDKSIEKL